METERLEEVLIEFIQSSSSELQGKTDEIPTTIVRTEKVVESATEGDGRSPKAEYSLREKKKFDHYLIHHTKVTQSEEASRLIQYVEDEFGLELQEWHLRKILLDVFGDEGEYLEEWEDRAAEAVEKLQKDVEEQTTVQRIKLYLRGIELADPALELIKEIKLRESLPEDFFREADVTSPSPSSMTLGEPPAIAEFETRPQYGRHPPGQALRELLLTTLRLYGVGNVHSAQETRVPQTYLGQRSESYPPQNRDPLPRVSVEKDDKTSISNLLRLLEGYYSGEEMEFDYPFGVAIDHYESSVETRTRTRESITFSIIGLESLYTQGRGKVSTHCAFILGSCHSALEPKEVKETISEAYDFRSGWVHGGRRKSEKKELQEKLWDYFRISIVVFGWLINEDVFEPGKSGRTSNMATVSDALIDSRERERLQMKLDELDLEEYLQLG